MNIELDGKTYDVPEEYQQKLILQLWDMGMKEYEEKLSITWRLMAKPITRKILYEMESSLTKTHGKDVAAQVARPQKGGDPNKHLLWILAGVIREAIKNATISIATTESTDSVTAFSISLPRPGEGGRQMDLDGDIREWEDNSSQNARSQVGPSLSDR